MKDRIKWVKHNILLKWTETISNTETDDGLTLNKHGAKSLNEDLYEIWNLLDDMHRLLSEVEKELVNEEA